MSDSTSLKDAKRTTVSKRDLDQLNYERLAASIVATNPSIEVVSRLADQAREKIPGMTALERILEIYTYNPDTITAYASAKNFQEPQAFTAILPLRKSGTLALFDGSLDTGNPDLKHICKQHETPHSIYIWGLFAPPSLVGVVASMMERLSSRKFAHATIYCKAATVSAFKFIDTLGFTTGSIYEGHANPDVLTYNRNLEAISVPEPDQAVEQKLPLYDSYRPTPNNERKIGVTVVHKMDELLKVHMIRGATYLAEQDMPFDEDLDGNDLTGTHLLGYIGDEPAGCLRIRYFSGFAKLERLAVLPRFRKTRLAFKLVRAGIEFCRTKGYTRFYGQTEPDIGKLWEHFGFVLRGGDGISYMTNRKYIEGDMYVDPSEDALTPHSGAYVLLRPEGQWHQEGSLEQSSM